MKLVMWVILGAFLCFTLIGNVSAVVLLGEVPITGIPNGTVHVDGEPAGMSISLDGVRYGNVTGSEGLELTEIPAGNHIINASFKGFKSTDTPVTVIEGQVSRIRIQLPVMSTGTLEVLAIPVHVQVYLDNEYKGITPITLTGVPVGDHMVLFRFTGYVDKVSPVTITPGGQHGISVNLDEASSPALQPSPVATATKASALPSIIVVISIICAVIGVSALHRRTH